MSFDIWYVSYTNLTQKGLYIIKSDVTQIHQLQIIIVT